MPPEKPKPPFPFPPRETALTKFPDTIPWDTPISQMANWWIKTRCGGETGAYPLRLLAAERGWDLTLRDLVRRLVCEGTGERGALWLVDTPQGDRGRYGAKAKSLVLREG